MYSLRVIVYIKRVIVYLQSLIDMCWVSFWKVLKISPGLLIMNGTKSTLVVVTMLSSLGVQPVSLC